jgi:6-pyruvoyltetrahydropterin/6-carboxytetrahydropterin synthase
MTIFIEDSFDSAHWLPNVPSDHKCHRLHGHTYRIRIEVSGPLDPQMGWVMDYGDLKSIWDDVKFQIDHHCINSIVGLENSTCENLAGWIWKQMRLPALSRIELRETERCGVVYEA